jgi:predicted DNA-binding protein
MASRRLDIRLPEEAYERLREGAARDGSSVTEFVRRAIEDRIAGRNVAALSRAISRQVVNEVLPEIERMLWQDGAPPPTSLLAGQPQVAPQVAAGHRPWDPQCYGADLHRQGTVCNECGGSYKVPVR